MSVQRAVDVVGTLYGEEETIVSAKVPGRSSRSIKDVAIRSHLSRRWSS